MTITLDLKILKYLDDGLPSTKDQIYKHNIKVYKEVSGVTDIVSKIKSYFSEIEVAKDISFNGDSLSVTESTTADNILDEDSVKEYFEKGFKAIANKQTTCVRLGFDEFGNIVPQFGGKAKYVAAVYATIKD